MFCIPCCRVDEEVLPPPRPSERPSSSFLRALRSRLPISFHFIRKLSTQHGIGKRIKSINARLEEISKERSQFQLTTTDKVGESQAAGVSRQTSPLVETDIVGVAIELHARCLIKDLVEDESRGKWMAAVTGMGGIGKTTLAQRVYNDGMIGATFPTKIWVCVSKEFSEISLLKEIVASAGGNPGNAQTRAQLEPMLRALVTGEKLLLVLDDIWKADVWEDLLRNPLQSCRQGSKVLITTRFENVARQMGAGHILRVEQMSVEDGWSLLCKKSFINGEEAEMETLKDVGVKIVERCGGLPLAIKLIGGILRGREKSRWTWDEILKNPIWSSLVFTGNTDKVMEALYLSYEDLPPHLKQCFLHLSLFPEDHVFVRPYVVQQWIAEGFVNVEGDVSLELKGEDYFRELVGRGLLQPKLAAIEDVQCTMHDLLRLLAQFLAQGENFFGNVSQMKDGPVRLRRLSISNNEDVIDLETLKSKEFLRSLFLHNNKHVGVILSRDIIKKLGRLRLLDLSGSEIEELPSCMRRLGHLRYLNVSNTPVRELPEWIGELKNLQFLLLKNCKNIHAIPNSITKLKNLRCLEIFDGADIDKMPKGIRGLVQLRKLIDFVVDKNDSTLEELGPLVNLHSLGIHKLERILDKEKAKNAAIKDKTNLRFLSLECMLPTMAIISSRFLLPCNSEEEEMKRKMPDVYDELSPPPSLQILNITGYMGLKLPNWMWPSPPPDVSPLHNLTWLGLVNCIHCPQLPPLGLLPHLKKLWLTGASAVTSIGPELLMSPLHTTSATGAPNVVVTSATIFFPKLEWMTITDMPNLEQWHWEAEGHGVAMTAFPHLENLYLKDCQKLTSLPQGLWHGPKRMYITDCPALKDVRDIDALKVLQLEDSQMETLPPWLGQLFINPTSNSNDDPGILIIKVKFDLLKRIICQKEAGDNAPKGDWQTIKHIPRVYASATDNKSATFSYMKDFSSFNATVEIIH